MLFRSDDFNRVHAAVNDHVLIDPEEEYVTAGEIGTTMTFAGKVGQMLESVDKSALDAVGDF